MIIYVDIDETICFYERERNYSQAVPSHNNISKINKLYDEGNTIIYWTARGATTGIDWTEVTISQLEEWNCKYHELKNASLTNLNANENVVVIGNGAGGVIGNDNFSIGKNALQANTTGTGNIESIK